MEEPKVAAVAGDLWEGWHHIFPNPWNGRAWRMPEEKCGKLRFSGISVSCGKGLNVAQASL
jgi:hypothetical protein